MTYKEVIEEFNKACNRYCLSDEYLEETGRNTSRRQRPNSICGEYEYGMVHMRDDAVEVLIDRIKELESE